VLLSLTGCSRGLDGPRVPDILLITLDTTRADRLGCYGYPKETTPHLDSLAAESVLYTDAYSTSNWTLPAHASLFTGKFPTSHGALYDPEGPLILTSAISGPKHWERYRARGLHPDEITLAGLLRQRGYATGAVVGGPWMKAVFGLDAGFDHYDDQGIDTVAGRLATDVTDRAVEWIQHRTDEPRFLFLNYFDPHAPYSPPEAFLDKLLDFDPDPLAPSDPRLEKARYDGEITYMDAEIGRLFAVFRDLGLWDDTWIIVTADHGELLGERGRFGHGEYLTEPEVRIPLIVKPPGRDHEPGTVAHRVQLTDILPMVVERLGLELPDGVQGSTPDEVARPIVAEVYPLPFSSPGGDWRALYRGSYKYVWNSRGDHELFRIDLDRREERNLVKELPGQTARMNEALRRFFAQLPSARPLDAEDQQVDPETRKALESLGYVD
jgi:arylsulfatase